MNVEEYANKFLKEFFDYNYQKEKLLFDNLKNIYILISFLNSNMENIEIDEIDFTEVSKITLSQAEELIDSFYNSIGINFKLNEIIKNGVFDIISTNSPSDASYFELTYGNNDYIENHKAVNVYNNGLITDTIIWIHEISHYRNQPEIKRGEVNDILTELLAFTESFIYVDYLEKIGYKKEAHIFKIIEYENFYNIIKIGYPVVRIYLLYFLLGSVSKEDYKYLYNEDDSYDETIKTFEEIMKKNNNAIFNILWYSVGVISIYNYERYKENPDYLEKIKELDENLNKETSLEDCLKIIDIKLDNESLDRILQSINKYKINITKEESNCMKI